MSGGIRWFVRLRVSVNPIPLVEYIHVTGYSPTSLPLVDRLKAAAASISCSSAEAQLKAVKLPRTDTANVNDMRWKILHETKLVLFGVTGCCQGTMQTGCDLSGCRITMAKLIADGDGNGKM